MTAPRITDEAVEAALDVIMDDGHNGLDCQPGRNLGLTARAALEAALPLLASQPVVDREALIGLLRRRRVVGAKSWTRSEIAVFRGDLADAVLALINGSAK